MFVVKYKNEMGPSFGFIKPYNAVRDIETYSLTYCPTSMINGISERLFGEREIEHIVRHKLSYNDDVDCGLQPMGMHTVVNTNIHPYEITSTHTRHVLVGTTMTLAFRTKEEAEVAKEQTIYVGQFEYLLFPQMSIEEMSDEEFDALPGVETFATCEEDEDAIFVGFNRFKENARMYIKVDRKFDV